MVAGPEGRWLRIGSPCCGSLTGYGVPEDAAEPKGEEQWRGYCSCCKRPLSIALAEPQELRPKKRPRADTATSATEGLAGEERYAYVVALWGASAEYVLGAMVLGRSLRRSGTKHDLVAMHTDDLPAGALSLLERAGWILRKVEYVDAAESLYREGCLNMRFAQVFTKLRLFGLIEYSKVLMLDADLLVCQNIDDLFELPAPAAMVRGPWAGYRHGEPIEGKYFFGGTREGVYSWGQSSGINAGVMLLQPSSETLKQCLLEVADPLHPEHIRGNGPEQDYLSRYFASSWTQIDVAYNFQLHHMYFALSPAYEGCDRLPFTLNPGLIKVIHYSSEPKPWARYLDKASFGAMTEEDWLMEIKSAFTGHSAWILKDPESIRSEVERNPNSVALGPDGLVHRVAWEGAELGEVIGASAEAVQGAEEVTHMALRLWDEAYHALATELGERDLAAAAAAAVHKEPAVEGGGGSGCGNPCSEKEVKQEEAKQEWTTSGGWWLERPQRGRAVASCGILPAPYVTLSHDGKALLSASGAGGAEGLHLVALAGETDADCPAACSFSSHQVAAAEKWARSVPAGVTVLLALLEPDAAAVAAMLSALAASGLGCPAKAPPEGYVALAAVGRKGESPWPNTHAAADVALATAVG